MFTVTEDLTGAIMGLGPLDIEEVFTRRGSAAMQEVPSSDSYCSVADRIQVPPGFPKVKNRSIWLGQLKGSWYDIGRQYGEAAAF
jgi:hypothetical protein